MHETLTRAWCVSLASTLEVERIDRNGAPYLCRYYAAGYSPHNKKAQASIYLHHFLASDPYTQVHSHPWSWSLSLILVGGYREHRCQANGLVLVREFRPGEVNVITANDEHRIELLAEDCWTLFCAGSYAQPWRFSPAC
jgi:hypothetical protein